MTTEDPSALGATPESISAAISSSPCSWVATAGEEIIGFAMVDLPSACLFALFVLPRHEGRGIGTALTRACEHALFTQHACAWLETAQGSRAARLYRRVARNTGGAAGFMAEFGTVFSYGIYDAELVCCPANSCMNETDAFIPMARRKP